MCTAENTDGMVAKYVGTHEHGALRDLERKRDLAV